MSKKKATFPDAASEWTNKDRGGSDTDLDITPMIDVTFLLLIFFMVTSTMQSTQDLDIPAVSHGVGQESEQTATLIVKGPASPGEDPVIVFESGREATLEEVQPEVERQMEKGVLHTIIKADGKVPYGFVQEVIRAVNEVEGAEFSIGVRDKKSG